jgi:hypothetical protein
MRKLLALAALVVAAAACSPDCPTYCRKLRDCHFIVDTSDAESNCVQGCSETGKDEPKTISCVISHSCSDLNAGHCSCDGSSAVPLPLNARPCGFERQP